MSTNSRKNQPQGATRRNRPAPEPVTPEGPAAERFRTDGGWQRWRLQHGLAAADGLSRLTRAPLSTVLTLCVLGIALAFPMGIYGLVDNARALSRGWNSSAQISVFLRKNLPTNQVDTIVNHLRLQAGVASVQFVSSQQAWEEFRTASGLGKSLDVLEDNPLPPLIIVQPDLHGRDPAPLQQLLTAVQTEPGVESAQFDTEWVQRLYALLDLAEKLVLWMAGLAGIAVLLVVGNTIRLMSQSYRPQIEVYKLLGATNALVRRPFLYTGAALGLGGGLVAWLTITASFAWLGTSAHQVAALYGSPFVLTGPGLVASLGALGGGLILGWGGSWLAVGRYLRAVQP